MEETRRCTKCGETKPRTEFSRDKRRPDGCQSWCKLCKAVYQRKYNAEHKEQTAAYRRKYYAEHPEKIRGGSYSRDYHLRHHYDISLATYNAMLKHQGGGCAICGKARDRDGKYLSVDHDHETGEIRGLLCSQCNHALGLLQESEELCLSAASYLHK